MKVLEWFKLNYLKVLTGVALLVLVLVLLSASTLNEIDIVNKLKKHASKSYSKRGLEEIIYIIIHHSASSNQNAYDYAEWHVSGNDWAGIGYHRVIEKDGAVFITQYLDTLSYHTGGNNTKSVGVCLSGNFQKEEPTKAQLKSLDKLIKKLKKQLPNNVKVKCHRDFTNSTECCGDNLYNYVKSKYK